MQVIGPAKNKTVRSGSSEKSMTKPLRKAGKKVEVVEDKNCHPLSSSYDATTSSQTFHSNGVPSVLRREGSALHSNLSLSASCSSDASTDSFHSRASTGKIYRTSSLTSRKKQLGSKTKAAASESPHDGMQSTKRCAWVTSNSDPSYVAFHDEEWGVPVHDDKKLFELLVLCGCLAELSWPTILSKRQTFREVFADFDPIAVAKLNEKKIITPGSTASLLLSELKLRAIIENARQVSKVVDEFGSFDNYIWSFVNHKPIVGQFRYPRQVPVKTPKADVISKDLMRRGFRSVGPTVVYSFMQVAGITNDHLVSCFRFLDCATAGEESKQDSSKANNLEERLGEITKSDICRSLDELSFSSE